MRNLTLFLLFLSSLVFTANFASAASGYNPKMDPAAKVVETNMSAFKPDPVYKDHKYDVEEQLKTYGGKRENKEPWYPFFFGRRMYPVGEFSEGLTILGKKNPLHPHFLGTGDLRIAYANFEDGVDERAEIAARLNLDLDLKLTSTERIHAFTRPLDKGGQFTRVLFNNGESEFEEQYDFDLEALFFEGDLGWIWAGISGEYAEFDLPFAFGLMPILFHNGIWFNDILTGVAFTLPAKNSPMFDISNMDFTFFAANDDINSAVSSTNVDPNDLNDVKLFGLNAFIEALDGYFEIGYGFTEDELEADGDQSYHNVAFSFSHRWENHMSLSYRVFHNFGQENVNGVSDTKTADGTFLLLESSFFTSNPYLFVPYLNVFFGDGSPQPLARQAGGILENVGLVFEGDGLTGFPTLTANANDRFGGAFGVEYLFNLDQQIVVEVAATADHTGGVNGKQANEYGVGVRYQRPLSSTIIFRADAMYGWRDIAENLFGARTELRWKF